MSGYEANGCWDDRSELCLLKVFRWNNCLLITLYRATHSKPLCTGLIIELFLQIFGLKTLVKSYLPLKDVHLCSGIDDLMEILKNILAFGEISRDIKSR